MNPFCRVLPMPPARLARRLTGEKEAYRIAVRPAPVGQGADPLPALGAGSYTPLPSGAGRQLADPVFYTHAGTRYLFAEAIDDATGQGRIEVCLLHDDGTAGEWQTALEEPFSLAFPTVFDWQGEIYMLPESSADHSLRLYRCVELPAKWELVERFEVGTALCGAILSEKTNDEAIILCSELCPENPLTVRWRRYTLRRVGGKLTAEADETFHLQHRVFGYTDRSAGASFTHDGRAVHPTRIGNKAGYGVYVQFFVRSAGSELPLCAATPQNVRIAGLDAHSVTDIYTYCRDDRFEAIGVRCLIGR